MSVPMAVRFNVLRRDGFRCRYCGKSAPEGAILEIDHVVPRALGGTDDPTNLVACCGECNMGKGTGPAKGGTAPTGVAFSCPTRLRVAAVAVHMDMPYRRMLQIWRDAGAITPPPERGDSRWMKIGAEMGVQRALAEELGHDLNKSA